ncbi:hypothetical protein KAW43_03785 [Candidatus Parcubacteria bacterium]|nr:hypothetical protein [Candidatus Parcubacteria bacterium]
MENQNTTIDDLAGMVQRGFSEVNEKFDKIDTRLDKIDGRLDRIEIKLDNVVYRKEFEALLERVKILENKELAAS